MDNLWCGGRVYSVAAGSVVGGDHLSRGKVLIGRNNQDAYVYDHDNNMLVAVVCDGCGGMAHSEIGAWIFANWFCGAMLSHSSNLACCTADYSWNICLETVRQDLLAQLRLLGRSFVDSRFSFQDYFLSTIVAAIITPLEVRVVAIGDGVAMMNAGDLITFGTTENNTPTYLAYDLMAVESSPNVKFKTIIKADIGDFDNIIIGSDGVEQLHGLQESLIPGTDKSVGPLTQFLEDSYFEHQFALERRLKQFNAEIKYHDKETNRLLTINRLLRDDTTMIIIKRKHYASGD